MQPKESEVHTWDLDRGQFRTVLGHLIEAYLKNPERGERSKSFN
ncbi:MAG: hypothetical protein QOJ51_4835 [Acidobacteriaceae bacterium]|jgi:hypothetical protein|nr:hypothetical protein [Acidobacteriaceae bacterium]MEA2262010.1 hypothetical protein [Acidobacteriaceae bacterium]